MAYKDAYKNIKSEVIALVKDFIEVQKPWRGTEDEKKVKFMTLLQQLCVKYEITVPTLRVDANDEFLQQAHGSYDLDSDTISLPKYSLVTFLHEFKHMLQCKQSKPNNEEVARGWSLSLFYQASPKAYETARRKGLLLFE